MVDRLTNLGSPPSMPIAGALPPAYPERYERPLADVGFMPPAQRGGGVPGQPMSPVGVTPGAPINTAAPASPTFQPGPGALPAQPGAQRVDPTFAGEPRSAFQMAMANLDQEHAAEQARYDQEEAQARAQMEAVRAQEMEFERQELQAQREDAMAERHDRARARDEVRAEKERLVRGSALEPTHTVPRDRPSTYGPTEREAAREMGYLDVGQFLRGPRQGVEGDFGPTARGLTAPGSDLRHPRPGEHLGQDISSGELTADIDRALGAAPGADEPIRPHADIPREDPPTPPTPPTRAQRATAAARIRRDNKNAANRATAEAAAAAAAAAGTGAEGQPAQSEDPEVTPHEPTATHPDEGQMSVPDVEGAPAEHFERMERERAREVPSPEREAELERRREDQMAELRVSRAERALERARERGAQAGARAFGPARQGRQSPL